MASDDVFLREKLQEVLAEKEALEKRLQKGREELQTVIERAHDLVASMTIDQMEVDDKPLLASLEALRATLTTT